jgi:hypothetical protein
MMLVGVLELSRMKKKQVFHGLRFSIGRYTLRFKLDTRDSSESTKQQVK